MVLGATYQKKHIMVPVTFARLYFQPSLFSSQDEPLLLFQDLLSREIRNIYTTRRGNKKTGWVITDNHVTRHGDTDFGVGKLGRISPKRIRAFDDAVFTEIREEVSKGYLDSCFVVDFSNSWIAFETKTGISVEQFCQAFVGVCMTAEHRLGFISLYPDVERAAYMEAFKKLKIIQKVRIEFVVPNPQMYELAKAIQNKLLIEPKAVKAIIDCEGSAKGLEHDSDIVKIAGNLPLDMPQYGVVEVRGMQNEDSPLQIVSSYDKAVKTTVSMPKEKEGKWQVLMDLLIKRKK
ncbi:hypothetical protein GFC01_06105 [Desulfofundulus thermobenzoicus]|uniref:Uncharacterized protein n=1 Tax=Desulfofundulus thermobenzoicus TaxID=29376 RepID=A0A6N7IQH9_9FIRM|nr:hypothetical protein [Desulfofundulus thermobenzoicus]MQL51843.1 hypothetical protein [Desulfofundulus thermobenzoicus]